MWLFYFLEFIEKYIYNTIGFLELQEVHKQYKEEVNELKMILQASYARLVTMQEKQDNSEEVFW